MAKCILVPCVRYEQLKQLTKEARKEVLDAVFKKKVYGIETGFDHDRYLNWIYKQLDYDFRLVELDVTEEGKIKYLE